MKLIRWSFQNVHMPMIENENGELCCTSKMLCNALGVDTSALRMLYHRHKSEFQALRVTESDAKEFLQTNRVELGIERMRDDMLLWTENDMILIAILSKSSVSKEFRQHLVSFIKKNATRGYVSEKDHMVLEENHKNLTGNHLALQHNHMALKEDHENLVGRFDALEGLVQKLASHAGSALNVHKKTRALHIVPKENPEVDPAFN